MCGLGQWLQDEGGRDQLGQAINCLMFAFLSLLRVRKGLIHFPQSSLALSTSAGRKHGWVENQTFNQLWGWGGVNLGEYQSWAHGGGWTCCALRPGTKSIGCPKVLEEFMETYKVTISFLKIKKLELYSYSVITNCPALTSIPSYSLLSCSLT